MTVRIENNTIIIEFRKNDEFAYIILYYIIEDKLKKMCQQNLLCN